MIEVSTVSSEDDIESLVSAINAATWDEANEISTYTAEALLNYLSRQDTLFLVTHEVNEDSNTFLGMASARIEFKPYDNEKWLYVDEVDVCVDQRKKGAGKAMMKKLLAIADEADCEEVWLGTETDNDAANALYQSLNPDEVERFVGYTYEVED
ncbi:MAG: GNAT family N-acetyltransferase [Gammaproteobacteria bacterium]